MKTRTAFSTFLVRYENLFLLCLALLVILIYAHTLNNPFIFDDKPNIVSNPHIRISDLSLKRLSDAAFKSPAPQRPLPNISFALNYYLHGYSPSGFRLVNILIHVGSGILLYFFVKTTLHTPVLRSTDDQRIWIAFFTAAVWMVHPLQTQSISYIVQRMNSMAAMFYVLSLLLYARFRINAEHKHKWWLLSGCILATILALASKQNAAALPIVMLAYEAYFFRRTGSRIFNASLIGCLFMTAGIGLILLGSDPIDQILSGYGQREFTPAQRLLTQPRVVMFYLSLLIWPSPVRLNLDHDFVLSRSLLEPLSTSLAICAIAAAVVLIVITAKKQPLISFGILWFFINLVIESSVIPLEIIFEHRTYLPSMMFCLLVVLFVYRWFKPAWHGTMLLVVIIAVCAFWTYERNKVYADRVTLWQDCVKKSPDKARPHNNLGVALADQGHHDEAIAQYRKTLQIEPHYAEAYANIGLSLAELGKIEDSIPQFLKTLELNPDDAQTHSNLGGVLILLERNDEAIRHLRQALRLNPDSAATHNNLGVALKRLGQLEEAREHFARARRIDPTYSASVENGADTPNNPN
ncbi:MAG: tetratricopeptide repeat protein [Desulfobacterales bacterium]|jgi:tetratricopeptide (TPR) repeat protein